MVDLRLDYRRTATDGSACDFFGDRFAGRTRVGTITDARNRVVTALDQTHPPAEVSVDTELATALLDAHCPELLEADPVLVDEGWDNFTFRVGQHYALRIPRRNVAVELIRHEQRWLPEIATWLSVDVPVPVFIGHGDELFAWPWSVVQWVDGDTAEDEPLDTASATALANVLTALHRPAPAAAPANPFRGVPLATRDEAVAPRLERLGVPELNRHWERALEVPPSEERVWLHGDLHPRNVVLRDRRLQGLIDWGDLNGGDRACDLACAWTLFERPEREVFLAAYRHSQADLARAAGWAVNYGTGLMESGEPRHVPMGENIIRRLVED